MDTLAGYAAGEGRSLAQDGFERYALSSLLDRKAVDEGYGPLREEFADLPPDPYGKIGLNRYRRHTSAVLLPWERELHWVPKSCHPRLGNVAHYSQGGYNPEHPHASRYFPAVSARAEGNPLLREIVLFDFDRTWWSDEELHRPLHVGVHFIKLAVVSGDGDAVSSPNHLHQDGEPFHFAHLVYKRNASGGTNYVAHANCVGSQPHEISPDLLIEQFDLQEPLDSYGIHDERVSHHVDPVRRGGAQGPGERAVVLVDITPMQKCL